MSARLKGVGVGVMVGIIVVRPEYVYVSSADTQVAVERSFGGTRRVTWPSTVLPQATEYVYNPAKWDHDIMLTLFRSKSAVGDVTVAPRNTAVLGGDSGAAVGVAMLAGLHKSALVGQ